MRVTLRDYQQEGVENIRGAFRRCRSVLYCLPTGGGKTVVFSYVTENAIAKGRRVAILVHRQELVDQARSSLERLGLQVGVIAPGHPESPHLPVQVCSVQSLVRRLPRWPNAFDLIVIDEAHHAVAGSWRKVLDAYPSAFRLGVTATPERLDGQGLGNFFEVLIEGPGTWDLMQRGHLAECRVFIPPNGARRHKLSKLAGEFRMDSAAEEMKRSVLMGDVVTHYKKHLFPRTAIAFCCTVDHAQFVADEFKRAGVRAAVIDGTLDKNTRRQMIQGLATGDVQVLCSCEVISEGTDVPSVGGALLLRPTNSLSLFLQQCGRCLRPAEGKPYAVILDHAGNVRKHGLPQDVQVWSLANRKLKNCDKREAPMVRVCQSCFAAIPGGVEVCPFCGAEVAKPKRKAIISDDDATLKEIRVEDAQIRIRAKQEKERRKKEQSQARTLEQLQALARERGYSPGWAYHIFNNRRGRGAQL